MRIRKALIRTCWWCGSRLVDGSVIVSTDPDKNEVQVHASCYDETERYARSTRAVFVPDIEIIIRSFRNTPHDN